ncbi:MAG TPA: apolipoprotein N-acyltransferase [Candidatus Binataceae bacterium]|nr:apolipoprotein N-acyltransferase [Candidatus Binataceae bacterium]
MSRRKTSNPSAASTTIEERGRRWIRPALAIASGLALAVSFPKVDLNLFAWVAFVPLFCAIEHQSLKRVFGYAWLQGWVCYVASIYWVVIALHDFGGVPMVLAVLPMLLLAAIMGVYTAIAIWSGELVARRLALPTVLTMPIAWTALEWVRTYFPIGFPWNLLGYTAYRNIELIQFAEFTGVYGVSALIMFFNVVAYAIVFQVYPRRLQTIALGTLTAAMAIALIFGSWRVHQLTTESPAGSLKVAMVQGDIPQSLKWDPKFLETSFDIYRTQTEAAAKRGADLVVWPEAAAAFFFQPEDRYPARFAEDAAYRQRLLELAARIGDPILFGAPALGIEDDRVGFYNRAYLVSGTGQVVSWYDKIHLVPFGEYVPLRSLLGGLVNRVVAGFGDMFAGRQQTLFHVHGAKLAVLICYESVFPDLTRTAVEHGAQILVNITNDAWYGESSAPYQLLAMTAMRSVETKAPIVRVANTGISAIIQADGTITARTALFKRGTEIEHVYWRNIKTAYDQIGDVFAEICLALTIVGIAIALVRPRPSRPQSDRPQDAVTIMSSDGRLQ